LEQPVASVALQVAWPAEPRLRVEVCVGGCELGITCQLVARPSYQVTSNKTSRRREARQSSRHGVAGCEATEDGAAGCVRETARTRNEASECTAPRAKPFRLGPPEGIRPPRYNRPHRGGSGQELTDQHNLEAGYDLSRPAARPNPSGDKTREPSAREAQQHAKPVRWAPSVATSQWNELTGSRIT